MPNKKTTLGYIVLWLGDPTVMDADGLLMDAPYGIAESFTRPQAVRAIKRTLKARPIADESQIVRIIG